jgi:ADP-heptose:LPS heptosyltransferase
MNILITRHDKIGDFITALPMCKVLKEQTNHKIIILVSKVNVSLAKQFDFIDDVIEYSDDSLTLIKRINKYNINVSISAFINNHLGLCLFLSNIKTRISPATKLAQIFFNKKVKQRRSKVEKTEWQYNLDLLHKLDSTLKLDFVRPLIKFNNKKENFIILHCGFGGSSDGNLKLDDYLKLAKYASTYTNIVFSFGPDDDISKKYIKENIDFEAEIKDNFNSLWDFTKYISTSKLFISTSTGPMHLAGLSNSKTMSFFGSSSFASSKRWSTISSKENQYNFEVKENYTIDTYNNIQDKLIEIIS